MSYFEIRKKTTDIIPNWKYIYYSTSIILDLKYCIIIARNFFKEIFKFGFEYCVILTKKIL